MNENELTDAFERILPDQPSAKGWAGEARRRGRRNRVVTGAAAIALAAAVAISVGLSLGNARDGLVATPRTSSPTQPFATPSSLVPDVCRDADGSLPQVTDLPDGRMPEGATRLWLCGGPSFSEVEFVGAAEPLVIGVDEAVAAFNSVPTSPGIFDCPANMDIGYTVIHEYADGSQQVVEGSLGGCKAVVGAGQYRYDAAGYLVSLQELWGEQRAQLGSDFDVQDECSALVSVMGVEPADMTRGHVCAPKNEYDEPDQSSILISLSDGLVADMVDEAASSSVPMDAKVNVLPGTPSMILSTTTGDPLTLRGFPWAYTWHDPSTNRMNQWRPRADLTERIWGELTANENCVRTADDHLRCTAEARTDEPTKSPSPSGTMDTEYSDEVMGISYQQEALVADHPDVFLGFELSDDKQTAIILCKWTERERCDQLVATMELPAGAPVETKEVGNSLTDIKAKRVVILQAAKDLGVDAVDALADRFLDGIVLEVSAQAFTDDGTLAPDGAREELEKLGMVEVRLLLPPPPETSIAGVPLVPEPDWSGSTIQDTTEELLLFTKVNGATDEHPDIFAGTAISRHRDKIIVYAKRDRMAEAAQIIARAGVDEAYWQLAPVDVSLSESEAAMPKLFELVDELGLEFSSAGPEIEAGGIVMELIDLQQLTTVSAENLARLKEVGVVGVRQGQEIVLADLPTADVEPSASGTNS